MALKTLFARHFALTRVLNLQRISQLVGWSVGQSDKQAGSQSPRQSFNQSASQSVSLGQLIGLLVHQSVEFSFPDQPGSHILITDTCPQLDFDPTGACSFSVSFITSFKWLWI